MTTQSPAFRKCTAKRRYRKSLHGQLANHVFSLGNVVKLEKLSYRAFQKMWGRSVGPRAPGKFVSIFETQGCERYVSVIEISTHDQS